MMVKSTVRGSGLRKKIARPRTTTSTGPTLLYMSAIPPRILAAAAVVELAKRSTKVSTPSMTEMKVV